MNDSKSPNRLSALEQHLTHKGSLPQTPTDTGAISHVNAAVETSEQARSPQAPQMRSQLFDRGEPIEFQTSGQDSQQMAARAFDFGEPISLQYQQDEPEAFAAASSWADEEEADYVEASSWADDTETIVEAPFSYQVKSFEADEESPSSVEFATQGKVTTVNADEADEVDEAHDAHEAHEVDTHTAALAADVAALRHEVQALHHKPSQVSAPSQTTQPSAALAAQLQDLQDEVRGLQRNQQDTPPQSAETEALTAQMQALHQELHKLREHRESETAEALSEEYWKALELEPMFQAFDRQIDEQPEPPPSHPVPAQPESEAQPVKVTVVPASEMTGELKQAANVPEPEEEPKDNAIAMALFDEFDRQIEQQQAFASASAKATESPQVPAPEAPEAPPLAPAYVTEQATAQQETESETPPLVEAQATEQPQVPEPEAQHTKPLSHPLGQADEELTEALSTQESDLHQTIYSGELGLQHGDAVKELKGDISKFLRTYGLRISAGLSHRTEERDKSTVQDVISNVFNPEEKKLYVGLEAPPIKVHFQQAKERSDEDIISGNISIIEVKVSKPPKSDSNKVDPNQNDMPVYLIPYSGDSSFGVKLPSGEEDAYAITSTIDGCTLQISGSPRQPYVSHHNVNGIKQDDKQQTMTKSLNAIIQAFEQEEKQADDKKQTDDEEKKMDYSDTSSDNINDPSKNRLNYGLYTKHNSYDGETINYQHRMLRCLKYYLSNFGETWRGAKIDLPKGNDTAVYFYTLTKTSKMQWYNLQQPPTVNVIGQRKKGIWTFYYQEYGGLEYTIKRNVYERLLVKKVGSEILNKKTGKARKFIPDVIFNSGRLWPTDKVLNKLLETANDRDSLIFKDIKKVSALDLIFVDKL